MEIKEPYRIYTGEYVKSIIPIGECACFLGSCIKRYYNVQDFNTKQVFLIEICNEYLRLKIRELYFKKHEPLNLYKKAYMGGSERSHIYDAKDILRDIIIELLIVEFGINATKMYYTNMFNSTKMSTTVISIPVINKLNIYQSVDIVSVVTELFDYSTPFEIKYIFHLQRELYAYFSNIFHHLLRYKKYKKQHILAEKYLKIMGPDTSFNKGHKDVYLDAIQLLFELKILKNEKSS